MYDFPFYRSHKRRQFNKLMTFFLSTNTPSTAKLIYDCEMMHDHQRACAVGTKIPVLDAYLANLPIGI